MSSQVSGLVFYRLVFEKQQRAVAFREEEDQSAPADN